MIECQLQRGNLFFFFFGTFKYTIYLAPACTFLIYVRILYCTGASSLLKVDQKAP